MKLQLIIFFSIQMLLTKSLFSQTTEAEYNYVTKGYKVQLADGLDMKKGYELESLGSYTGYAGRTAEVLRLIHTVGAEKKSSAYMIIYQYMSKTYYLCIPHPNSDKKLQDMFLNDLLTTGPGDQSYMLQVVAYTMAKGMTW